MSQASLAKIIFSLYLFAATSCGYVFQGAGTVLPPDVRIIAIPTVQNSSAEAGLSAVLTESLRDRFERFGVFTVREDLTGADAVLNVVILDVKQETRAVTSATDTALQFDTILTVAAELRRSNGAILWRNPNIAVSLPTGATGDVIVVTSPDFAQGTIGLGDIAALDSRELSRGQEQEALLNLSAEAARRIYNQSAAPEF